MTLSQRLAFLDDERRKNYVANLKLSGKAASKMFEEVFQHDAQHKTQRAQHLQNMLANGATHQTITEIKRRYLKSDLTLLGFTERMLIINRSVIFYLAESEKTETDIRNILAANPSADLYSYEEPLCFLITRIDEPKPDPKPDPKHFGFIDV